MFARWSGPERIGCEKTRVFEEIGLRPGRDRTVDKARLSCQSLGQALAGYQGSAGVWSSAAWESRRDLYTLERVETLAKSQVCTAILVALDGSCEGEIIQARLARSIYLIFNFNDRKRASAL